MKLPLHHLRVKPNATAGMNLMLVAAIAHELRTTLLEVRDPILVRRLGPDDWLILEGRHRWVASLVAGRYAIEVEVEE